MPPLTNGGAGGGDLFHAVIQFIIAEQLCHKAGGPDLTAVGVTAQNQVCTGCGIGFQLARLVVQQDGIHIVRGRSASAGQG